LLRISIPTGAIKRFKRNPVMFYNHEFQFLPVRLKDPLKHLRWHSIGISIPTGTIKRHYSH